MFCSSLSQQSQWNGFLQSKVWRKSIFWLIEHSSSAELGTYQLGEDDWYANVHQYTTKEISHCVWESHQYTIDIQYMISGREQILWMPTSELQGPTKTFDVIDRQEWNNARVIELEATSKLVLSSGFFAIFLPNEGHCPMIKINNPSLVRKTVIKIPSRLFFDE